MRVTTRHIWFWMSFLFAAEASAGTVAYWEFDEFSDGTTPSAVGGTGMDLRTAGGGADFQTLADPAVAPVPNPDRSQGFSGDAERNQACIRSPGNPLENRFLATRPGTNVLHLDNAAWTVEGWIRCSGDAPEGFGDVILTTRDAPHFCGFSLKVDKPLRHGGGRRLSSYFQVTPQKRSQVDSSFHLRTDELLIPGQWQHIALTWNDRAEGQAVARLFVNGLIAACTKSPTAFDTQVADQYATESLRFAGRQASERNSFSGDLDEFRIVDHVLQPMDMLLFRARPGPTPLACDVAERRELHPRAPRAGDVLMRSLRWHDARARGGRNTMRAMDQFHVTGLVWAYIHDPEVIGQVRDSGRFFQGAVTNSLGTTRRLLGMSWEASDSETHSFIHRYGCLSLDGTPNEQPWKRHWSNPFSRCSGCCSNPDFEPMYVRAMRTYVDAGATMIQRDEATGNARRPNYGGCFCDYCVRGFRRYLGNTLGPEELGAVGIDDIKSFDYRRHLRDAGAPVGDEFSRWDGGRLQELFYDYQHYVTLQFMARTRKALNEQAGFDVAMSCNNGVHDYDEIMQQFAWFFGELRRSQTTPAFLYRAATKAASLDKLQIITMPKKGAHNTYDDPGGWERHTRRTIATSYAVGGICMVPWDVYMPDTFSEDGERSSTPRYFGTAEDYADLFGFIRANPELFDGYEDGAAIGPGLFETRWGRRLPVVVEKGEEVYAFVRAKPHDEEAPVVLHLIDWRDRPRPFRLRVRRAAFFGSSPLNVKLCTPAPFDAAQHAGAEAAAQRLRKASGPREPFGPAQAEAYAPLSQTRQLQTEADGDHLVVRIPALTPWGLVVVSAR